MPTDCVSYQNSGYFSSLIQDYLNKNEATKSFYNHYPSLDNFLLQIEEKTKNYTNSHRNVLVATLQKQYAALPISQSSQNNIHLLQKNNTFTVTTGHQLNLFTGPLYFLYKIISTINVTKQLKEKYPDKNFVPIYWMATEDHDFEEINYFNFRGKKFHWNTTSKGPVGRLSTQGLDEVFALFEKEIGNTKNAEEIKQLFKTAYLEHENLADATRFLANELFGNQGLLILDADDAALKQLFSPFIKEELLQQTAFKEVSEIIKNFNNYNVQVTPRNINLFYIEDGFRERIVFEDAKFKVNNTKIEFTEAEILEKLQQNPEKFSPNVIMRPLYQEVILPNLCYIGGGGEIAYWLELATFFKSQNIAFPMLLLRNSALIVTQKQTKKADALSLSWANLFQKQTQLINESTKKLSDFSLDLSNLKQRLAEQFQNLHSIAAKTDASFLGALKAQETKQTKGLENLEKRLLKAQKKKLSEQLQRITELQNNLFPNQSLQERETNFSEFYLEYGSELLTILSTKLQPLTTNFEIVIL